MVREPFSVKNDWFSGECDVLTYALDELVGTKVRALYQRLKGRDLFDVYTALISGKLDFDRVMTAYDRYLRFVSSHAPTYKEFVMSMDEKIKNPEISGTDYQQGDKFNFWNIREYVLFRDNHECQCCHGKSKDLILNIHHIESRKVGGNAPNNLITLCKTCHTNYHKGKVKMPKTIHRGIKFNDTAFMGLMRWQVYNHLKEYYTDVSFAYGYKTKNTRIEKSLPKEHFIDARCISGNPEAISDGVVYYQKKIRCHNRQIYKFKVNKGGTRKKNQAPYLVNGFRLYDKVIYNSHECFITGRRSSGQFMLKNLDWSKVSDSVSFKKLSLLETSKHYLTERRFAFF